MTRLLPTLLAPLALLLTACASAPPAPVLPALPGAARAAPVLLLGEVHDNPLHHAGRAAWLRALLKDGKPTAVVFEQMTAGRETDIAAAAPQGADAVAQAGGLDAGWRWPLHRPLVQAALDGGATIVGGNLPRDVVRAVARGDTAAVPAPARERLQATPWTGQSDAALSALILTQHCGQLPAERVPGMVAAQRVRDAAMAEAVARQRAAGKRVVLIAGNEHVRKDRGVPLYLRGEATHAVAWLEGEAPEAGAFDQVIQTAPASREDPCAGT